jgi:rubrerythrin
MFTLNDICDIAIQIERNGERIYREAGKRSDDLRMAQLFNWMADEERRHGQWFQDLRLPSRVSPEHEEIESMGRSLLQEMMENQPFSLEDNRMLTVIDLSSLLDLSIEFEQDTIMFYEMLRSFIDEAETGEQLDRVIAEELGHVRQLELMRGIYAKNTGDGNPAG